MSYTTKIKNEIVKLELGRTESIAQLSGFIRNNGYLSNNILYMTTENKIIKDELITLIEKLYETKVEVDIKDGLNFNKKELYVLSIKNNIDSILKDIGYYSNNKLYMKNPPEYIIDGNAEIRAYLRGAFLAKGSINDPKTSRYHMEILMEYPEEAILIQKLLNLFDLNSKILNRDKGYMVYIKESEKISDFLKMIGAIKAVLYFEDIRTLHDKINHTNRLNNCEQANIDKVVASAQVQLKNIEILEENVAVELLDDKTKEALEYRKKYPEASLKELSEIISLETNNKITKSGLNHRFRKINDLANKIKNMENHNE